MIWWQVPGSSLLSDLIAAGAFVLESHPFLSNAPPADGLVELVPLSGEELSTPFAVSTFGWTDEQESLISYSFVRFPLDLSDSSRVSAEPSGGITLHNGFMWSVPKIDWRNSSSQMYFRKQGGLTLQTWVLPSVVSFWPGFFGKSQKLWMTCGCFAYFIRLRTAGAD